MGGVREVAARSGELNSISFKFSGMDSAVGHDGASYCRGLSPSAQNRVTLRLPETH